MATLARQIPSVDTFLCEPWSSFVGAARLRPVDNSSVESGDGEPRCPGEAVQLGEQVMLCRSRLSALEDFSLVVCHVCNQVVTPQGILTHYGSRGVVTL